MSQKNVPAQNSKRAKENPAKRPGSLAEMIALEEEEIKTASTPQRPTTSYKDNVKRQVNEQKSVGGILSVVAWGSFLLLLVFIGLGCYGAYVVYGELAAQKVTTAQLRTDLIGRIESLETEAKNLAATVTQQRDDIGVLARLVESQGDSFRTLVQKEKEARDAALKQKTSDIQALSTRAQRLESQVRLLQQAVVNPETGVSQQPSRRP